MSSKSIYIFIGTTAELIKLAPVIREFNRRKIEFTIIASGQNVINFDEFQPMLGKLDVIRGVTPKSNESSVWQFVIWSVRTFFSLLVWMRVGFRGLNKKNSYFIVHGDTVSSLMGALVCSIYGLKLVHIESGLRSFNFFEPFPEEICRFIISKLANIHFCPNDWCVSNLASTKGEKINTKENTLIEVFWESMKQKKDIKIVSKMKKMKKKYYVLVSHRQEHVIFHKDRTKEIIEFVVKNARPGLFCIFVMHDLSAAFINTLEKRLDSISDHKVMLVNRLVYTDYMNLLKNAEFMVTDGGSNQEEMYYMGKPCLLLRNVTERIEGLNRNVVLSQNRKSIIKDFLTTYSRYNRVPIRMKQRPSKIIVDSLFT